MTEIIGTENIFRCRDCICDYPGPDYDMCQFYGKKVDPNKKPKWCKLIIEVKEKK